MNCANCGLTAVYVFADPGALPIAYCATDLPEFLRPRANLGDLPVVHHVTLTDEPDPMAKVKRAPRPRQR